MIKKIAQSNRIDNLYTKWICDDVEDIPTLPPCQMGSTVYVIHTQEYYMLDNDGKWCKMSRPGGGGGSGSGDDIVEESTIWGDIPIT